MVSSLKLVIINKTQKNGIVYQIIYIAFVDLTIGIIAATVVETEGPLN